MTIIKVDSVESVIIDKDKNTITIISANDYDKDVISIELTGEIVYSE